MPWVRIDDGAPEHPKHLEAGPTACWLWVWGLCYCARQLTDGLIPSAALPRFAARKDISALVRVGLWDATDGGYRVHDYAQYQPSKEQVEAERESARQRMHVVRAHKKFVRSSPEHVPNFTRSSDDVRGEFVRSSGNPIPSHPKEQDPPKAPHGGQSLGEAPRTPDQPLTVEAIFGADSEPPTPEQAQISAVMARWERAFARCRHGATYRPNPVRDYQVMQELAATYGADLDHLQRMFEFFFMADDLPPWAATRSPRCFLKLAPETDAALRESRDRVGA